MAPIYTPHRNVLVLLVNRDFSHVTSSPNGLVEKYVHTAKQLLKKAMLEKRDAYMSLLEYRNTPIRCSGLASPALDEQKSTLNTSDYRQSSQTKRCRSGISQRDNGAKTGYPKALL